MNESTNDYIYIVAWIMIFLLALGTAYRDINTQLEYQRSIHEASTIDHRLFTEFGSIEEETYSGAEVLQSIQRIHTIGASIQVEGKTFSQSLDIDNTDVSMIKLQKTYKVKYVRDTQGVVTNIVFT